MTLKVKVNHHHFQYGPERLQDTYFVQICWPYLNMWRVILLTRQVLGPKWPWGSRSLNPIFNGVLEGPKLHIWCKFGDPSSKKWWFIALTNSCLWIDGRRMNGRTDRRTEATTIPLRPKRPRGKNAYNSNMYHMVTICIAFNVLAGHKIFPIECSVPIVYSYSVIFTWYSRRFITRSVTTQFIITRCRETHSLSFHYK